MEHNSSVSWLGQEPEFSKIDKTIETDVIVCGGGLAGVAAVRSAAEAGADVILFEKCKTLQGRSGQFCVMGGNILKHWDVDVDQLHQLQQPAIDRLWDASEHYAKREIIEYAVTHSGEDFDWYLDGLPKENVYFCPTSISMPPVGTKLHIILMRNPPNENYDLTQEPEPVYPATIMFGPSHVPVLKNNFAIAEQTGHVQSFFATPVKKLLRDSKTGRVTGVVAVADDGTVIEAHAKKAVILTTGDYTGDPEILKTYFPQFVNNPQIPCGMDPHKKPANTGDGHRMGMWIGAKLEDSPPAINCHNMGGAMGVTPFLMLDTHGRRFMNEDATGSKIEQVLHTLPDEKAWQIFDSSWRKEIPYMPHGHGCCSHAVPEELEGKVRNGPMDGYASQNQLDKAVESGSTVKADTLEELVEKMALPKDAALSAIQKYTEDAKNGTDTQYGKRSSRMFPLDTPPYYGSPITKAPLLCAHAGLESDEKGHSYDENNQLIPGLYLAGNVQGRRFAVDYPTILPGLSHSMALTFGRLVGRLAAEEAPINETK